MTQALSQIISQKYTHVVLTLKNPGGGDADIACIPSIFIKLLKFFFDESCVISAFTKIFFWEVEDDRNRP